MDIEYTNIRDVTEPQRDGSFLALKRVEFFLGKHGPFTERFPTDATASDMEARIRAVHTTLLTLPTSL